MKFISPLLKHLVYPGLARAGYFRRDGGSTPAVITYHGVTPKGYKAIDPLLDGGLVSGETLGRQLRLLKTHYRVISPQQFLDWCEAKAELPPRSVLLTCDDGLRNTLSEMLPILQEAQVPCLFFITGASLTETPSILWYEELYLMLLAGSGRFTLDIPQIGVLATVTSREEKRTLWWEMVNQLSRYESDARRALMEEIRMHLGLQENWSAPYREDAVLRDRFLLLSPAELRRIAEAGMSIGAHTMTHPILSRVEPEAAWREISESRRRLEEFLGQKVWALAYPSGENESVTRRELQIAEQAGFTCAFLNVGGGFGAELPRFAIPRVHVTAEMTLAEFEAHFSGFYGSLRRRFRGGDEPIRNTPDAHLAGD